MKTVLNAISSAKDKMVTPEEYIYVFGNEYRSKKISEIYKLYQKVKEKQCLDFDDIIIKLLNF